MRKRHQPIFNFGSSAGEYAQGRRKTVKKKKILPVVNTDPAEFVILDKDGAIRGCLLADMAMSGSGKFTYMFMYSSDEAKQALYKSVNAFQGVKQDKPDDLDAYLETFGVLLNAAKKCQQEHRAREKSFDRTNQWKEDGNGK